MRIENIFCEDCGIVHYIEVLQRNEKGLVIKTKCHGKEFAPVENLDSINDGRYYIKHRLRGYDLIMKEKPQPRKRLPTTFHRERPIPVPVAPAPGRKCLAELSFSLRGKFQTIKVFEDATPERFYEFFDQVGDKPTMTKPRNLGREKAIHLSEIAHLYRIESSSKPIYHNRAKYEKLLSAEAEFFIMEKNLNAISAMNNGGK